MPALTRKVPSGKRAATVESGTRTSKEQVQKAKAMASALAAANAAASVGKFGGRHPSISLVQAA